MIEAIPFLNMELSPCLKYKDFSLISTEYQEFFKKIYLKQYSCNKCSEYCILDILEYSDGLYYLCPSGYIETEQRILADELKRYEFKYRSFLQKICFVNSINFYLTTINNKVLLFGEKEINKVNYKFFYTNQLFNSRNRLNESKIYQIREYYQLIERAVLITPQSLVLNNSNKAFLNDNNCQIFSLKDLLNTKLVIDKIGTSTKLDIDRLINSYEIVIIDFDNVYLFQNKLKLSPKSFDLLKYIALKGKEGLSASYNDCIEHLWQNEAIDKDMDYFKQLQNHRSDINKACQKADIEEQAYKNFIKAKNQSYKLMIEPEKIYIT